ncbi:DUF3575 domain-containing protein [Pontibacter populi]|uniref:DUF3575 domain-containing protein n=1 Tax=Pontibacter populi TaxID=890055 RepID=A0ABV1RSS2_9BACT
MKRILLLTVAAFALFMGAAQAQSNVFKINILSPVVRTGSVFYERTISEDKSAQLGFFYTGFSVDDTKFSGFGFTPEFRKYLSSSSEAPAGFYIAPFLRLQSFKLKVEDSDFTEEETGGEANLTTFGGGLLIGRQWVFADRFVLDTFLGPSYNAGSVKTEDNSNEENFQTGAFSGFGIRTGLALGIKF